MMPQFASPARPTLAKGDELHRTQPATGDHRVTSSRIESQCGTMWQKIQEITLEIPRNTKRLFTSVKASQHIIYHNIYVTYITYIIYHNTLWHMRRYPPQATGSPAVVQSHLDPKLPPRQHFHSSNSHVSGVESLSILQLFPTSHES